MKYTIFCDEVLIYEYDTPFSNKNIKQESEEQEYKIILDRIYSYYKEVKDTNKYKLIQVYEDDKIVIEHKNT